ncbi:hypothetical protein A7975_07990 [Bacillus sp. FJAT-26390]|nr:hypothetical protein A7975_07990 [Bacillus sp. FJAT-26390]
MRRVLASLIAVNDQSSHVFMLFKCPSKHLQDKRIVLVTAQLIDEDSIVPQILDDRQIDPLIQYAVLCNIRNPLLIKAISLEVLLQLIL